MLLDTDVLIGVALSATRSRTRKQPANFSIDSSGTLAARLSQLAAPYWVEVVVSIAALVLISYGAILANIEVWRRWKRYRLAKSG